MAELLLFPRLPTTVARSRLLSIKGRSITELGTTATADCPDAVYPPTGGTRVARRVLEELREELVARAQALGFPKRSGADAVRFDWVAAPILLQKLGMHPGEACRNEVWSFLTIQLLPDLTTWRFPKQNDRRFMGGDRNAFQRLWWRAFLLQDAAADDPWHLIKLPEDALVGLMERPGISSNPPVARSIAQEIARLCERLPSTLREEGWRLAYRRVRQRVPLVNLDGLAEAELAKQLSSICSSARNQLSG